MRIHTGEKPYECSFEGCHKKFRAQGHLTDHMKIHSKVKPFQCKICGGKFTRSSTLKIHSYTHMNIKPFKCPYKDCDRGFTEKGNMQIHMRTHKKEKCKKRKTIKKQKEEKKQEQKIQSEPQIVMNPVNNVNVWNCFIPFYPMNYQIINNINNIYYTNSTQGNIQEKGVGCNMMMQSTSANYSNQMWNYN